MSNLSIEYHQFTTPSSDTMPQKTPRTALARKYMVKTVADSKSITKEWLDAQGLSQSVSLGLPEIDDRYHVWRVPLKRKRGEKVGELVIDAQTSELLLDKSTDVPIIEARRS
ncbi:MAG: hypothetical protein AAGD00_07285 [Planctomycetota bacterium]